MSDPVLELRREVFRELERGLEKVREHGKNNVATQLMPLQEDIRALQMAVNGDGNGRLGLIRTIDELKRSLSEVDRTGDKILAKLDQLERQPAPLSMRPEKGKLGLSQQTIQYIVVGVLAALGAGVSTVGGKAMTAPSEKAVDTQAEALAQKKTELEKARAELEKERQDLARQQRWQRYIERERQSHPMRPAPEAPASTSEAEPPE